MDALSSVQSKSLLQRQSRECAPLSRNPGANPPLGDCASRPSDTCVYVTLTGDPLDVVYVPLQHQALWSRRCADAGSVDCSRHRSRSVRDYFPLNEVTADGNGAARADG